VTVCARFEDTSPEEFRRVIEINYLGQVHGALAASPRLRRNGGGALISVSSVEGSVSLPLTSAYAASKHAVEGALDALRRELLAENVPISFDPALSLDRPHVLPLSFVVWPRTRGEGHREALQAAKKVAASPW